MCDYQGYEFGASYYLDSICIDGFLWDADACDTDDNGDLFFYNGGEIPCPQCNRDAYLDYIGDEQVDDDMWGTEKEKR